MALHGALMWPLAVVPVSLALAYKEPIRVKASRSYLRDALLAVLAVKAQRFGGFNFRDAGLMFYWQCSGCL